MKSAFSAAVLAFLFGPLGMVYVSFGWGFVFFLLSVIAGTVVSANPVLGIALWIAAWIAGIPTAIHLAGLHNRKLAALFRGES